MKKAFLILLATISILFFPVKANALTVSNYSSNLKLPVYTLQVDNWNSGYDQTQTCTGDDSVLGNPKNPDSVAWLLDKILTWATIIGMVLVVVFSSIDFLKVIVKGDDDSMTKAAQKLAIRLILAALLFFVPTITNTLLDIFGLTSESTCGIQQ